MTTDRGSVLTAARLTLGVDPSFNRTGWAVLTHEDGSTLSMVACGIVTPSGQSRGQRLESIQRQFSDVLARWTPREAYFERPGNWQRREGSRRETIEVMAMARGVMLATCAEKRVPAWEIDFHTVRRALLGRGNANAAMLVDFVTSQGLPPPFRPRGAVDLDVANAIAMAIFGMMLSKESTVSTR